MPMLPQFAFTPHDFANKNGTEIRAMGLSLLGLWTVAAQQFVAPVGHDEDAAARAIADWADVARRVLVAPTGQEAIATLSSYFLKVTRLSRKRLAVVFDQHIGSASMKKFVSTYDRITRESKAEGKAEVRVEMLLRLLQKRFGPLPDAVTRRVSRGSTNKLDTWIERLLDAKTLPEVFAD
jgi:hypothetical protein